MCDLLPAGTDINALLSRNIALPNIFLSLQLMVRSSSSLLILLCLTLSLVSDLSSSTGVNGLLCILQGSKDEKKDSGDSLSGMESAP